ncbi:MAG: NUDIX domain-containing protein [Candidatus Heimdallarchaeaceae archaeon]
MKQVYVGMAAVIEKNGKFLILKRSADKDFEPNNREVVTGRLEAEEDPAKGILREVQEETNLEVEVVMPIDTGFFYRGGKEFPMVFISYYCKYVSGEIKLSWEHSEYQWVSLEEALKMQDLRHFHNMFSNIQKLKKYVPDDFQFSLSVMIE